MIRSRSARLLSLVAGLTLLTASPAAPADPEPSVGSSPGTLTFCSATAIPRAAGGVLPVSDPYPSGLSRYRVCNARLDVDSPIRVTMNIRPSDAFFGEVHATLGDASVTGLFAGGERLSGQSSVTFELPDGSYFLDVYAGHWAMVAVGGGPVPLVWAGAGPLDAAGDLGAEVLPAQEP